MSCCFQLCLLHSTLLMKCAFTDSLFSAEDEAFILKRLVVLSQHPLLRAHEKLFYMDCILHFPENRPISCSDSDETLPVLLTPCLASTLLPTVVSDCTTMLARLNLLSLVYLEEGEEEEEECEEGKGLAYLYEHLILLLHIVSNGGSREMVVTSFRTAFLFLLHFSHVVRYSNSIMEKLCELYRRHTHLAPHLINLADQTVDRLPECGWAARLLTALQRVITDASLAQLTLQDLRWHLKVLARVAEEGEILQHSTLSFLSSIITPPALPLCLSSDWRLGNAVLRVCRRLLVHPSLDSLLIPLADILQQLACCYGNRDIQDHARLYYTLVTTLSREKLAEVLAQGANGGGGHVKQRTLSCIMAHSDELTSLLTFHQIEKPILRLVELTGSETDGKKQTNEEDELSPNNTEDPPGLGRYRDQFKDPHFASEIILEYQLTHEEAHNPGFDQIFNIRLHFHFMDPHYEELSDISIPCVFRERASPTVKLRLKPRKPFPTTLHTSAIFNTQDGLSWHTHLPDTHVAFQQAFMPLPAPSTWGGGDRLSVFEELWNEICCESGGADQADSTTSLFCCQLGAMELGALVEKHFRPFLISDPSHEEEYKVLCFLPPQSHILLKIRLEEDAVHFDIATDNWQLLPHISSFLLVFTSSQ